MGCDTQPRNLIQIFCAAIGMFMGAIINANIFSELAMILQGIGQSEQVFQSKLSKINTVMINIKLPFFMS